MEEQCNPLPLAEWLGKEDKENCRSCILPVTMAWYHEELREQGRSDLANELTRVRDTGDPAQVARLMDNLKEQVTPELRLRLREFDCLTQDFENTNVEAEASS